MNGNPEILPPAPSHQIPSVPNQPKNRWWSVLPLCFSVMGAVCLIIGSSAPTTRGLSGQAFEQAFEANEEIMFWPVFGFPLALAGLSVGLIYCRSWSGKIAVAIALLSVFWFFRR